METKSKKWRHKLFPTELEHAIDVILFKYENNNLREIDLIDSMFDELMIKREFKKLVGYNLADENEDGFIIKEIFKNDKYEEQLAQLKFMVHLNNGTFDRVVKRIREYQENINKSSRIAEALENISENEKIGTDTYLKKVV